MCEFEEKLLVAILDLGEAVKTNTLLLKSIAEVLELESPEAEA